MEERDKAYIAGIIDGEGYIGIGYYKSKVNGNICFYPKITIATTSEDLLLYLNGMLTGVTFSREGQRIGNRKTYHYNLNATKAYKLLKKVKEYMVIKRAQAEVLIRFYEEHPRWNKGNKQAPQALRDRKMLFHQALKALNHDRREQANQLLEQTRMMPCSELYGNIESN